MATGDEADTPTLAQVMREAIDSRLIELHTAMPARVVTYDSATQLASVQPLIKRKYADGRTVEWPVINTVPVVFPRGGGFFLAFPLKPDDEVLLVVSERNLDEWKEKGGIVEPTDPRKFHITDAYAVAGIGAKPKKIPNADPEKLVMAHQSGAFEIHAASDGKVSVKATELSLGDHALTEFVAIASRVQARLAAIESNLGSHTHPVTTAPGVTGAQAPPFVADTSVVASSKVKVAT